MDIKSRILSGLHGTGCDQVALRVHDELFGTTGETKSGLDQFEFHTEPEEAVLFPLIPGYRSLCYRYCILADAFRRRGYEPILLVNEGALDAPIERTIDQNRSPTAQTTYYQRRIPGRFGLDTVSVSEVLGDAERTPNQDPHSEADVGRYARGSTRKHLKRYSLEFRDEVVSNTYDQFFDAGQRLATATTALFDEYDIAAVVAHEPYYIQGGIPLEIATSRSIPGYSQVWGFRKNTLLFGRATNRSLLPQYTDQQFVERVLSEPLSETQRESIERILEERAAGRNLSIDYSAHTNESVEASEDESLVVVFTNLLWDASLEPEQATYADVFDWLSDTVDTLGGREETKLVVKTHPAEGKFGTNESVTGWFEDRQTVPENVTVLPPETDIDTYALLEETDIAVVYNSTVGLEAACRGVPVVVSGDTHYKGYGFTVDADSKSEYRELLVDAEQLDCSQDVEDLANRYAHMLFVRRLVPFRFCRREHEDNQQFEPVTVSDTKPGAEPFDTIVSQIVNGETVVHPDYSDLQSADYL